MDSVEQRITQYKKQIKDKIQISVGKSLRPLGGQHAGLEILPVILKSEELGIELSIKQFRQNHKNKDYGMMLFDLIIEDLIK